jgi:hypothetical protein
MNALTAAGWTVRVTGLVLVVLGLLIWAGIGTGIVGIHMLVGLVLVIALWATAALALKAGARPILPVIAVAWGLVVVAFGMSQATILPGDGHVIVEVAHLAVGLVAIGLGEALVATGSRAGRVAA